MYKFIIKFVKFIYINSTKFNNKFKKIMCKKDESERYVFSEATICLKLLFSFFFFCFLTHRETYVDQFNRLKSTAVLSEHVQKTHN
jgi:hypothetical protein